VSFGHVRWVLVQPNDLTWFVAQYRGWVMVLAAGHTGTATTETVYRKQIRPVVVGGAEVMDSLFPGGIRMLSYSDSYSMSKGHDFRWVVMPSDLVGRTGFEPVTSSVSGKVTSILTWFLAPVSIDLAADMWLGVSYCG
jgi:hypothetical protein